ncbi:YfbK domain-containing protein [Coraliomargarita parva]|uniref:YfbK domain-containing protein n=1 Tax=Coraliomargarita parva TaxID=3014050 RepID=UPI0022B30C06|nr:von Willebrand factor type A domain-containing protein [Coraliomargarita parva]
MKILPDDPRLTAYAIGEVEDEQERAVIEAAVAADPELQATVEATRSMAALLSEGLASEAAPELSEFEKAKMEQRPVTHGFWKRNKRSLLGLAAALALCGILIPQFKTYKAQTTPLVESSGDVIPVDDLRSGSDNQESSLDEGSAVPTEALRLLPAQSREAVVSDLGGSAVVENEIAHPETGRIPVAENSTAVSEFDAAEIQLKSRGRIVDNDDALTAVTASDEPAFSLPHTMSASSAGTSSSILSSVQIAAVEVDLPVMSDSFEVSAGLGAPDMAADAAASLRELPRLPEDQEILGQASKSARTQIFGLKVKPAPKPAVQAWNTEKYDPIEDTDFRSPRVAPLSTFSIDVDTASYANVRRFLNQGQLPPADAVRIEELINYFPYSDAAPTESLDDGGDPFAVHMAQTFAPWEPAHRLLRIALKGYEMPWEDRPASNLVFLLDVSGSMNSQNKLPLVKEAMDILVRRLDQRDRVAIVVYAGASGLVLPSTTANNTETIQHAMENLKAGGSTNAGAGIELAYKVAREHFIKDGNNRVILCTDGDFNVGLTDRGALSDVAETQAEEGVSLTILGFGMGNYKDDMLETLSNKGKGSYAYVDSRAEARKVFLEDLASNIFKIAKDVKIQVEFNPAAVNAYRLIGYENRRLKAEDFNNDKKKAGDIGPGHSVVALYEIVPSGVEMDLPGVDALKYQQAAEVVQADAEVATVKLRYKQLDAETSKLIQSSVRADEVVAFKQASEDIRFCAAVAAFGLRLRGSDTIAAYSYSQIERIAADALDIDPGGHRSEFTDLVRKAEELSAGAGNTPE